jgi:hypothetical protein
MQKLILSSNFLVGRFTVRVEIFLPNGLFEEKNPPKGCTSNPLNPFDTLQTVLQT